MITSGREAVNAEHTVALDTELHEVGTDREAVVSVRDSDRARHEGEQDRHRELCVVQHRASQ